jgi:hypothetical protein
LAVPTPAAGNTLELGEPLSSGPTGRKIPGAQLHPRNSMLLWRVWLTKSLSFDDDPPLPPDVCRLQLVQTAGQGPHGELHLASYRPAAEVSISGS